MAYMQERAVTVATQQEQLRQGYVYYQLARELADKQRSYEDAKRAMNRYIRNRNNESDLTFIFILNCSHLL